MTPVGSGEIDLTGIDVPDRSAGLRGYLAAPEGTQPRPGVVVVFEAFGLDDEMRRDADRLAAMGYLALAPDLYSDGGAKRCVMSTFRALQAGSGRPFADLEAARQWLLADPRCSGRVGVIGFCMGGGFALLAANRGFDASAVNYNTEPRGADALDAAIAGACPVVASFGGRDAMTRGMPARLEAALRRAGVVHDVVSYPRAGHSFLNDRPNGPRALHLLSPLTHTGPEPASAAHAWARIDAFFGEHLR